MSGQKSRNARRRAYRYVRRVYPAGFFDMGESLALARRFAPPGLLGPPGGYQYLYAIPTAIVEIEVIDMTKKDA